MFLHSYKHKGSRSGSSALASLPDSCVFTNKSPNCDWELSGSSSKEQIYKEHLQNAWGFGPQNDTTGDRIMSGQRQTLLGSISWGEWYCAILFWNRNKMQINTFMGALFEFTSVAIAEQWKKKNAQSSRVGVITNLLFILLFSHPVVSDSLRPHELQHARPPCSSPPPRVCPNSCSFHQWCRPAISSSDALFSFCPQSLITN